jgi:hypothetical protein
VTYVSVGRLTQSAPAADIGLDFTPLLLAYNLVSLPSTQLDVRANTLLSLASLAMQAGAIWFLFRPDARAWFDSKGQ